MHARLSHVMMWATELDKTIHWYRDVLGFTVDYHAPGEYASMHHPSMGRLDFHATGDQPEGKANVGKGPYPYYRVDDLDQVLVWLRERGIKVEEPQQVGDSPRHTWFWDPEGNTLGLEEE